MQVPPGAPRSHTTASCLGGADWKRVNLPARLDAKKIVGEKDFFDGVWYTKTSGYLLRLLSGGARRCEPGSPARIAVRSCCGFAGRPTLTPHFAHRRCDAVIQPLDHKLSCGAICQRDRTCEMSVGPLVRRALGPTTRSMPAPNVQSAPPFHHETTVLGLKVVPRPWPPAAAGCRRASAPLPRWDQGFSSGRAVPGTLARSAPRYILLWRPLCRGRRPGP